VQERRRSGLRAGQAVELSAKVEPLALRVAAGDVVKVKLTNAVDTTAKTFTTPISGARPGVPYSNPYAGNSLCSTGPINFLPSTHVGLHPQLLAFDVRTDNGINVGGNPDSTVPPGQDRTYTWYAGTIETGPDGKSKATPVEFGAVNLMPADPLNHAIAACSAAWWSSRWDRAGAKIRTATCPPPCLRRTDRSGTS
jgi:hypothetical protein